MIIGVDIACETQYVRAFDHSGLKYGKVFSFSNDNEGFEVFSKLIDDVLSKRNRNQVVIEMEPTGHYCFNIVHFPNNNSMRTILVNPPHVKRSKELNDNNLVKNDRKASKTIAMIVNDGRYMEWYLP